VLRRHNPRPTLRSPCARPGQAAHRGTATHATRPVTSTFIPIVGSHTNDRAVFPPPAADVGGALVLVQRGALHQARLVVSSHPDMGTAPAHGPVDQASTT
jgi:hypothetical protein